jgi:hypothetical protein
MDRQTGIKTTDTAWTHQDRHTDRLLEENTSMNKDAWKTKSTNAV